jgi:shikimate kinase
MGTKLVRSPGLFLAGFMGSGKTTVGRLLADEMGWQFIDLDDDIECGAHCTITEVFLKFGEPEFRRLEHNALRARVHRITCGEATVLALGGGAYAEPSNRELLAEAGVTVWLDAPLDLIRKRIESQSHRPLAQDPERFERLYLERQPCYASADYRIAVDSDDPVVTVARIMDLPLW